MALLGHVATQRLQPSSLLVTIQPVYCDPKPPAPLLPCHDTLNCIVTRPANQASPQSRYNSLYRDSVSQPLSLPIAIQFSTTAHPLQPCHDTISHCIVTLLGSSPTNSAPFVFFVFHHIFFHTFATGQYLKIHIHIFFSFSGTPNKFLKNLFYSIFFSFTPCKTLENNFLPINEIIFFSNLFYFFSFSSFTYCKTPKNFLTLLCATH